VNDKIINDPNKSLEDPYDTGWLIKLEPDNFDEEVKLIGR